MTLLTFSLRVTLPEIEQALRASMPLLFQDTDGSIYGAELIPLQSSPQSYPEPSYTVRSTTTAVPYASTSITPCITSVAS